MKRSAPLIVIILLAFFTTVFAQDQSTPSPASDDAAISATKTTSDLKEPQPLPPENPKPLPKPIINPNPPGPHPPAKPLPGPQSLEWGEATLIVKDGGGNIISTMTGKYPIGKAVACTWVSCNCKPNPGGTVHCDLCCR